MKRLNIVLKEKYYKYKLDSKKYKEEKESTIIVNFVSIPVQTIVNYSLTCKKTELFQDLLERVFMDYKEFRDKNLYYMINARKIDPSKTISDNNINNKALISIFVNDDVESNSIENNEENFISIYFTTMSDQSISNYCMKCKKTDLFNSLVKRLFNAYPDLKQKELYFMVNTRKISRSKTISENKIKNNDIIGIFIINDDE